MAESIVPSEEQPVPGITAVYIQRKPVPQNNTTGHVAERKRIGINSRGEPVIVVSEGISVTQSDISSEKTEQLAKGASARSIDAKTIAEKAKCNTHTDKQQQIHTIPKEDLRPDHSGEKERHLTKSLAKSVRKSPKLEKSENLKSRINSMDDSRSCKSSHHGIIIMHTNSHRSTNQAGMFHSSVRGRSLSTRPHQNVDRKPVQSSRARAISASAIIRQYSSPSENTQPLSITSWENRQSRSYRFSADGLTWNKQRVGLTSLVNRTMGHQKFGAVTWNEGGQQRLDIKLLSGTLVDKLASCRGHTADPRLSQIQRRGYW